MTSRTDILIVGGGLNGTTLALALARVGLAVTLIDSADLAALQSRGYDGRCYALALGSQRMLTALGLWPQLAPDAQPILQIKASDGHAGAGPSPLALMFDHAEIEEGPMGFMVEDHHLRRTLLQAVAATPEITHLTGTAVAAQSPGSVTLDDGRTLPGALTVGADGQWSGTARRAGIRRTGWAYGQSALVCTLSHDRPHGGTAHQMFMLAGPLAILPLTGNRSSIVWTESSPQARAIQALPDADYLTVLRPRFGDFLGDIGLTGPRYSHPLALSLANALTGPRLALVGDAAHRIHPIAGQGLNLGLRDVAALSEVIAHAARRGEDIGADDVLARYQAWRSFDIMALALATDGINRLFSNDNPLLRAARDIGLAAVNSVPGLRRRFIREAAGLTGDLPRLLQGKPI